jgi:hypothetical protein
MHPSPANQMPPTCLELQHLLADQFRELFHLIDTADCPAATLDAARAGIQLTVERLLRMSSE